MPQLLTISRGWEMNDAQNRKALNALPGGRVVCFHEIGDETNAKSELVVCGCGGFVLPSA